MSNVTFEAIVRKELYYSYDTGYGIYYVEVSEPINNLGIYFPVVGNMQQLLLDHKYKFTNMKIEYSKKYESYQAMSGIITANKPKSEFEQRKFMYLITSTARADAICDAYPNVVLETMKDNNFEINTKVIKGVGDKTWKKVKEKILSHYVLSDLLLLLQPHGITFKTIKGLLSQIDSPELLKQQIEENPYILTKLNGFGFKRVDVIALKINPEIRVSAYRTKAFVTDFFFQLGDNNGDTYIEIDKLVNLVHEVIPECSEIFRDILKQNMQNEDFLHIKDNFVGLKFCYDKEVSIYEKLKTISDNKNVFFNLDISTAIKQSEEEQGFEYTSEQRECIIGALSKNISFITGNAGTGKSTVLRAILKAYLNGNYNVSTCALSAKAAGRIAETTGRQSNTIHRLLGWNGNAYMYNEFNTLPCHVLIIDEASMIGASLFADLMKAVGIYTRIVVLGDVGQLPPIGFGNIFSDCLNLKEFEPFVLTQIMRQAQQSGIIMDSINVRKNKLPVNPNGEKNQTSGKLKDMFYWFRESPEALREIAIKTYIKAVEEVGTDEAVILVPMRKDSVKNSTTEINTLILNLLIPDDSNQIIVNGTVLRVGAKVIQRQNDYDRSVFNGDTGYVKRIWTEVDEDNPKIKYRKCIVNFNILGEIRDVEYDYEEMSHLELAYAMTCHMAQGSGFDTVIGIMDTQHSFMLDCCIAYTLMTRAKRRCALFTMPKAFILAVARNNSKKRKTWISIGI